MAILDENEVFEIKKKLKTFYANERETHSTNVMDFKVSKNISSGNGFTIWSKGSFWRNDRAQVPVNLLEPIVNSVVYKFTESPFDFKDENVTNLKELMDITELKFQISTCLRDICVDGIGYLLVYKKEGQLKFQRLNNFNVIYGQCNYSDGEDVKELVYVDKKRVKDILLKDNTSLAAAFDTVLNLQTDEVPVLTYYRKECYTDEYGQKLSSVNIYKFEGEDLVDYQELPIDYIPIIRFYGKEQIINEEKNWRGFYYLVKGLCQTCDTCMSAMLERIATGDNTLYTVPVEAIGKDNNQWTLINDLPKVMRTYKSFYRPDANHPGVQLPAPVRNDPRAMIDDLVAAYNIAKDSIYSILGTVAGETTDNVTAEAILLRRETKDTAISDVMKNLLDSTHQVCAVINTFTGLNIYVIADLFEKLKKQDDMQKLIALSTYVSNNPFANVILPSLIDLIDINEKTKNEVRELVIEDEKNKANESEQIQQLMQSIQMLKEENTQLRSNAEAQMISSQMTQQTNIAQMMLTAEIKGAEIELEWAKLGQKAGEAHQELLKDVQKIQDNYEIQQGKLEIDAAKAIADLRG